MPVATAVTAQQKVIDLLLRAAGTTLLLGNGERIEVKARPHTAAAAQLRSTVRRVERVEITASANLVSCAVVTTGWRRSHGHRVPLRIGLGLISSGTTGTVTQVEAPI